MLCAPECHEGIFAAGDLDLPEPIELEAVEACGREGPDGGLCGGLRGSAGQVDGNGFVSVEPHAVGDGDGTEDASVAGPLEVHGHEAGSLGDAELVVVLKR